MQYRCADVFLSGAWQDEQTGAHFATLLDKFTNAPVTRFIARSMACMPTDTPPRCSPSGRLSSTLYVAEVIPNAPALLGLAGPLFEQEFGAPLTFPEIPYSDAQSYDEARTAYESDTAREAAAHHLRPGRIAGPAAGCPRGATGRVQRGVQPMAAGRAGWSYRLYLQPDGTLSKMPPTVDGSASSFMHDPEAGQRTLRRRPALLRVGRPPSRARRPSSSAIS